MLPRPNNCVLIDEVVPSPQPYFYDMLILQRWTCLMVNNDHKTDLRFQQFFGFVS